jgi:hypothetical protein
MNERHRCDPSASDWHASSDLLAAYARGRTNTVDAWSLETHLVSCSLCRAELAAALTPADHQLVRSVRHNVVGGLPQRRTMLIRQHSRPLRWTLRPGALIAVAVAVFGAALLDLVAGRSDLGGGMLWLLAPAIPVVGVAVAAVNEDDPCWDAVLSTPSGMLRLILWRTLAVSAAALPLTAAAGLLRVAAGGEAGWNAAWLLPCLALTVTTLAAGAFVGVERAAGTVAALWGAAMLIPLLIPTGGDLPAAIKLAARPLAETFAFSAGAQPVWACVALLAAVSMVLTHGRYGLTNVMNRSPR